MLRVLCGPDVSSQFIPPVGGEWWPIVSVSNRVLYIAFPFWLALALVGVPTAVLWWPVRRRKLPGHCQKCGYDLTGNVSGRCPECGEAVGQGLGDAQRRVP